MCTSQMVATELQVILRKKKMLRDSEATKNIIINEDLTSLRYKTFRYWKDMPCVKTVFTREGGIHYLLHEKEHDRHKHIIVDTPDDLFKLGVGNPDWRRLGLEERVSLSS